MSTNRFCLQQIVQLFCEHSREGVIKMIIISIIYEIFIKFYMSNDSFKYYYCLYCTYDIVQYSVASYPWQLHDGHAMPC
jgi:hypothetical protein